MAIKKCACKNPPSVKIRFGSLNKKEKLLDTIIPLGLVIPSEEKIWKHLDTIKPHVPRVGSLPIIAYEDNEDNENLKFKITVDYCTIDSFSLVIKALDKTTSTYIDLFTPVTQVIDTSQVKTSTLSCGDYFWNWDGYSNLKHFTYESNEPQYNDEYGNDVLNTSFLKTHKLILQFDYQWKSGTSLRNETYSLELRYEPISKNNDWLDVSVTNRTPSDPRLRLTMRPTLPNKIDTNLTYIRTYDMLKEFAKIGLEHHWMRDTNNRTINNYHNFVYWTKGIPTPGMHNTVVNAKNMEWRQTCRAIIASTETDRHSNDVLPLKIDDTPKGSSPYSWGLGKNIPYNTYQKRGQQLHWNDVNFMMICAHELGHNILDEVYNSTDYSWGHKGTTSKKMDQREKKENQVQKLLTAADLNANKLVEWDVMRYWSGATTWDDMARTVASVDDVRGAIYMCRMQFDLKSI